MSEAKMTTLRIGRCYKMLVNQGWRETDVLGIIEEEGKAIVEYIMPNGSTSLRIIPLEVDLETYGGMVLCPWEYKNVSYFRLPKKWLRAICWAGSYWYGEPQQSSRIAPEPEKLWTERYPNEPLEAENE